jgi:glycosyltransferase involved in cell wall biosynthesis
VTDRPEVSVIIPSYKSGKTIDGCLRSVLDQRTERRFEVIVIHSGADDIADRLRVEFPQVRLFSFSERKFPEAARRVGIAEAQGDIIAGVDADCTVPPDWLENVARAHRLPHPAIGGAVGADASRNLVAWASYFCEFNQWMPGTARGWMDDVAGASMTYKKWVFDRYGLYQEHGYGADTAYHWRLARQGIRVWFEPSIQVFHAGCEDLVQLLRHEVFHGAAYARIRVHSGGFRLGERAVHVVLWPAVWAWLLARATRQAVRTRVYVREYWRAFPLTALAILAWTAGETIGFVRGR